MKTILCHRLTPFWLITIGAVIGLTVPVLIQDGMFMDAMLYTSVSHNLGSGIGTFWFPKFSELGMAGLSSFHEQPPLVFGIQATFFWLFGDSMYVERFYTFLTTCITVLLIWKLWKEIFPMDKASRSQGWLPVLFWITVPVCFWSYSNNMHENTMGIFTLLAVLYAYKASKTGHFLWMNLVIAGMMVFLATFSKGMPGFFPLGIPFLHWIVFRNMSFRRVILFTLIISSIPLIIYVILFILPGSGESLTNYLFKRALHRINAVPTVDNRFFMIWRLGMEMFPQILLAVVVFLFARLKKMNQPSQENIQHFFFFLLVGLSATVPLMLTLVQKGFYFIPALPYFAIALTLLVLPPTNQMISVIETKKSRFRIFSLLCFLLISGTIVLSVMQIGKAGRNKELLHDVYLIGKVVPKQTTVSIPKELWNNWDLQCYLVRYFNIYLEAGYSNQYCLANETTAADSLNSFTKLDLPTTQFDLYEKNQ